MLAGMYWFIFTLPYLCICVWTISPWESKLAMFQYKEDKKLAATCKVLRFSKTCDWRLKFKSNEPWNTETHKTDQNPPITNNDLLFPKSSGKMWRQESADSSEFDWCRWKAQNPKMFWLHRLRVIRNSCNYVKFIFVISMAFLSLRYNVSPKKRPKWLRARRG